MVDAHALGACGLGRAGSNPASPTRVDQIENSQTEFCSRHMIKVLGIMHLTRGSSLRV